jgi:hypothetical protein
MPAVGDTPVTNEEGTSFATAIVASEVANLLSYDQIPFYTSDGKLVKNMKEYFVFSFFQLHFSSKLKRTRQRQTAS